MFPNCKVSAKCNSESKDYLVQDLVCAIFAWDLSPDLSLRHILFFCLRLEKCHRQSKKFQVNFAYFASSGVGVSIIAFAFKEKNPLNLDRVFERMGAPSPSQNVHLEKKGMLKNKAWIRYCQFCILTLTRPK